LAVLLLISRNGFFATQPINRFPSVEIRLEFGPMGVGKMSNIHQGYWAEKWEKSHF